MLRITAPVEARVGFAPDPGLRTICMSCDKQTVVVAPRNCEDYDSCFTCCTTCASKAGVQIPRSKDDLG